MAIEQVGVVGSGIMGTGIAEVVARAGGEVVLRSRRQETADAQLGALGRSLDKQVAKGRLDDLEAKHIIARVTATSSLDALADCDLVVESVVEDLAVKRALFAELDQVVTPGAILATNTSTLPVIELAMATGRPERVCGLHFFNPAPVMDLVEVVRTLVTSGETVGEVTSFVRRCAKRPVEVKDRAGFIVNALLFPYLNDAVRMLEQGTAGPDDIDVAMTGGCGFPMGPLALLDLVGIDTSVAILDALYAEFRDPRYAAVPTLRRMRTAGHLGRKSGRGFHDHGV